MMTVIAITVVMIFIVEVSDKQNYSRPRWRL
jgi:hypothetical protein